MLWEIDINPKPTEKNSLEVHVLAEAATLSMPKIHIAACRGYLIQGNLDECQVRRVAQELLVDTVVEDAEILGVGIPEYAEKIASAPSRFFQNGYQDSADNKNVQMVYVLPKPGVMDPVALSALAAIKDMGITPEAVRTFRKYWISGINESQLERLCWKVLANDAIEQVVIGMLPFTQLEVGSPYLFKKVIIPIRGMNDEDLKTLSIKGQLYLSLVEMQTIRDYFIKLDRDPTDVELETVAQTWSEHCSHKTLAGRIEYYDPDRGKMVFKNMLKETIFAATVKIREKLGKNDWCVSVFQDNAGVVRFDEDFNICFKVETHNHPSALEPYGGANTGIGGVIRDPMGTGMGAKPVCNTDVFCFAPPDMPQEDIPVGVLHPRRVMRGVVSGVRDYGNRMGIPTINGAVYFHERYMGNPLVYCGNIGIIPRDKSFKQTYPGDLIVAVGGRTGRDGIHGATFSSAELTHESDTLSGGAVQIGNAITEKMVLDVMLEARDRGLYTAVTDCGAGGFSSAVGEMGEKIGAEVWLEKIPLKYDGLSYTEMWISEAQERMVFSVPEEKWPEMEALCFSEGVEATVIGRFVPTNKLELKYDGVTVADLEMSFLHDGRPPVIREAVYEPPMSIQMPIPVKNDYSDTLGKILGSLNVASKHWIVRQYDHEVQGGSAIKPLVGVMNDGPGDASVVCPRLGSAQGVVVSCGMNPYYGDYDTYWMACSAMDEALRNAVAVGADPSRIAVLDNFCWGNTDRPETLGSLVRSALACHDMAVALDVPFISGKDSLNNEFRPVGKDPVSIPPSLLISAMGQVDDVGTCVTMDLKAPENYLIQVGVTRNEMGGSHFGLVEQVSGGQVPKVDFTATKNTFHAMYMAIQGGLVCACHDMSEGGLAAAAAEMAFSGGLGISLALAGVPHEFTIQDESLMRTQRDAILLFSESNTRFLCEVIPENLQAFMRLFQEKGVPAAVVGMTEKSHAIRVLGTDDESIIIAADLKYLKECWQKPLNF